MVAGVMHDGTPSDVVDDVRQDEGAASGRERDKTTETTRKVGVIEVDRRPTPPNRGLPKCGGLAEDETLISLLNSDCFFRHR